MLPNKQTPLFVHKAPTAFRGLLCSHHSIGSLFQCKYTKHFPWPQTLVALLLGRLEENQKLPPVRLFQLPILDVLSSLCNSYVNGLFSLPKSLKKAITKKQLNGQKKCLLNIPSSKIPTAWLPDCFKCACWNKLLSPSQTG